MIYYRVATHRPYPRRPTRQRNALKHGRYTRVRRQVRELDDFLRLHHWDAYVRNDQRILKRYRAIIERLEREKAELSQAVFERRTRSSAPRWILDEIARAAAENRVDEIE
jgi:carotenoid cleavage dioxygenase-like enzyme